MSKLGWLNYILLQWFCIRLARVVDDDDVTLRYTLLKWVVPMTGWKNKYRFIGK